MNTLPIDIVAQILSFKYSKIESVNELYTRDRNGQIEQYIFAIEYNKDLLHNYNPHIVNMCMEKCDKFTRHNTRITGDVYFHTFSNNNYNSCAETVLKSATFKIDHLFSKMRIEYHYDDKHGECESHFETHLEKESVNLVYKNLYKQVFSIDVNAAGENVYQYTIVESDYEDKIDVQIWNGIAIAESEQSLESDKSDEELILHML